MDYDIEKSDTVILPPPAIQPEPVFITVPEKHESVYGFHTKEIIHMMPDKPLMKDVATQTDYAGPIDPVEPKIPAVVVAPVMKRKKAIKKPKKMFIPSNSEPMDDIEEDAAAEIPIDIPDSPGARSVAPLGDIPPPMVPLNFSRNPKPAMPEPVAHDAPHRRSPQKPQQDDFDPRGLRSPPIPTNGNNDGAPKRMTFSPIADDSDDDSAARIPSPPRERKSGPRNNDSAPNESQPRPTLKNNRLNEMPSPPQENAPAAVSAPPPNAAPARSPARSPAPGGGNGVSGGNGNSGGSGPRANPFANIGGGGSSPAPFQGGNGGAPNDDVAMRAARGRLGGAVRGGGGGGEAPSGWKPWAKGGARR